MPRRMLTDELWSKLKAILRQQRIYDKPFLRDMVEGMLYRMRVGCPWRDLPKEFGCWNTIFQKFNRWPAKNKLMMIFRMLVNEPDLEWEFIDVATRSRFGELSHDKETREVLCDETAHATVRT